ncbi:SRPBCC family protein [Gordonia hankookensis]|uniref:SRPBCC family protein n=1 Tax=Gordonia hankookensis TaxID=589403 RepID=A0ABR7WAK4_9ACTN|nr:SRPBCC family protein [Gordonia hankookensis]MBD1319841.1 SRPBCC family protein [Gordonia hankookensis]
MAAPLIEESIDINASAEDVWAVISDLKRMGEWSPQCKKMIIRGGTVGLGTRSFNINRRGPLVWPTTAKVVRFSPAKELAFRVAENRTVWSYTIEPSGAGVRLTEKREVGNGTTKVSSFLVDKMMGGTTNFEAELKLGMAETLEKIKRTAESSATRAA